MSFTVVIDNALNSNATKTGRIHLVVLLMMNLYMMHKNPQLRLPTVILALFAWSCAMLGGSSKTWSCCYALLATIGVKSLYNEINNGLRLK